MFASQLLRILQTLPADVKYEPGAFETADLKVKMKENQDRTQCHSDGYGEEPDSLSVATTNFNRSNGHAKDVDHLALQTREADDFWNIPALDRSAIMDNSTKDTETEIEIPPKQENQTGLLYHLIGCEKDGDPLTSDGKDGDELWNIPELEYSMIIENDFVNSNKQESQDSAVPFITSSELFPSDTHLSTHKNMESELPKLIVCYKEINYHVVKDTCIDEVMPDEGRGLADRSGPCLFQPSNESRQNKTGGDFALLAPDGSKPSSGDDIDDHAAGKCETKEGDNVSLIPGKLTCSPEGSRSKDGPEDLGLASETKCTPNNIENGVSEEESIVTSMLPLKKFGTRSFLRSFMDSLDKDGDEVAKHPNQGPPMEANLESLAPVLEVEESNTNGRTQELVCDSKGENGTITLDFNSSKSAAADSRCRSIETTEQSLKSDNVLVGLDKSGVNIHQLSSLKNMNSSNPFIWSDVQSTSGSTENIHQEIALNNTKWKSTNPFTTDDVQSITIDGSPENSDQIPMLNHGEGSSNPSTFSEIKTTSMGKSTEDIHQPSMLNATEGNSTYLLPLNEAQNVSMYGDSGNLHAQPVLNQKVGKTSNLLAAAMVQGSSMGGSTESIHPQPELKHNNINSNNPFATEEVQSDRIDGSTGNSHANPFNIISYTDQGESSFSAAAGPVSGLITFSGPITHSGSTSVRSDSSTTSTRSFAFPVLQPEWNSSPVRMGKADGRRLRKHWGWKQGILCCRF